MKNTSLTRLAALPLVAALSLGLAGCGDSAEEGPVTVTSVTKTTIDVPGGASGNALTDNKVTPGNPDFSNLSMDPTNDPKAKKFLKAVNKAGINTKNMESAVVGMGYMICYANQAPKGGEDMEDAMAQTLASMQPGSNKEHVKKVVRKAAKKHLCK